MRDRSWSLGVFLLVAGAGCGSEIESAAPPAEGPTPSGALATGGSPHGLALGDDRVCWTDQARGSVRCVAKAGGTPWSVAEDQPEPSGIALDGDGVYWTDAATGAVMGASPGGAAQTLAEGLDAPRAPCARGGGLYGN